MQAVLLAAGRGKRLHPVTAGRTKAMAPILGKPIIERVMDTLRVNGIRKFILVINPDDDEILNYFESQSAIDADIIMITQRHPLGMGHALLQAVPYIHGDFVLSSCDNLVDPNEIKDMLATWDAEKPNAILTTLKVGPAEIIRMGIVELSGVWITRIIEKPSLDEAPSNIGSVPLYVFSHQFLDYLTEITPSQRGEYEIQDAVQLLIEREGFVRSFLLSGRTDLTTPEDLLWINLQFLVNEVSQEVTHPRCRGTGTRFIDPVRIENGVTIGVNCTIGPNVYLEGGCTIGDGVNLENVVVLRHRVVAGGRFVKNRVIW